MVVTQLAFIKYVDEVQACDSSGCGLEWSFSCCTSSFSLTLPFSGFVACVSHLLMVRDL